MGRLRSRRSARPVHRCRSRSHRRRQRQSADLKGRLVEEPQEAWCVLPAPNSEWAEARARWCAMAAISAKWLALRVAKLVLSWGAPRD